MTDNRFILNSAYDLNRMEEEGTIASYYFTNALIQKENIYNRIVTLLTMCINKELSILLEREEAVEEEYYISVKKIYNGIVKKYQEINEKIVNQLEIDAVYKTEVLEYLNNFVICLLSGVKYIEKKEGEKWHLSDEDNEWNTRYRREERVRDYMKKLISRDRKYTKFTIKNRIEIPYMYVLAWDLPNLYERIFEKYEPNCEDDRSYIGGLRKNTSIELKHISDNMLDILLHGVQRDSERYEEDTVNSSIKMEKIVAYTNLLPTIIFCQKVNYNDNLLVPGGRIMARRTHQLPKIKREILQSVPLIPMKVESESCKSLKAFQLMLELLKEENKTKDYLESDILYLKNCIVKMCELLLDWIWKDEFESVRIDKLEAEQYLIEIIKNANTIPRENNNESRETYIKKLFSVIVSEWHEEQLDNIEVTEKIETYIEYACFSVLKLSRNWNGHKLKGINRISIEFVVFIFIISLRYIVKVNQLNMEMNREYLYEEAKLFKFFKRKKIDYVNYDVSNIEWEYKLLYHNVVEMVFKDGDMGWVKKEFPRSDEILVGDPHQVLNAAGYKKSLIKDKMSESEIFLAFWLVIHMGKAQNKTFKLPASIDINVLELLNYIYEYQKESFLLNRDVVCI